MLETAITASLLLLSLTLIGFFAGSESALTRLDGLTVKHLVNQRAPGAASLERLLADRQCLLGVLLIGTNLAVVMSTVLATLMLQDYSPWGIPGTTLSAGGMVVLILICGEILPKRWANAHASEWSLRVAKPLEHFYALSRPLASLLVQLPRLLSRNMQSTECDFQVDEDSLLTMVDLSEEGGEMLEVERDMIFGVLEANHTQVRDVMVPRVDISAVAIDEPMNALLKSVTEAGFSRIPVYDESIDNVVGVLYQKDLLEHWEQRELLSARDLMRAAYFVPQTKMVSELFRELKQLHIHMAIVVDEYGGTAGLVTIEDLLEEIVGEIQDEYDWDEEAEVVDLGSDSWLVDARLSVDEINELIGRQLPTDDVDTIGGLAYLQAGCIPSRGETILMPEQGVQLVIAETNRRRITKLRINRIS